MYLLLSGVYNLQASDACDVASWHPFPPSVPRTAPAPESRKTQLLLGAYFAFCLLIVDLLTVQPLYVPLLGTGLLRERVYCRRNWRNCLSCNINMYIGFHLFGHGFSNFGNRSVLYWTLSYQKVGNPSF